MIPDYHIHTAMCRHAEGDAREYVERALETGMTEMGFADHLPFLGGWQPRHELADDWAMLPDELDDYVSLVQSLAREYEGDVRILLGIEADFIPDTLDATAEILHQYSFEYVIGSVHIIGDRFGFDHPGMVGRLGAYGIDRIHLESLELVRADGRVASLRRRRPPRPRQEVRAAGGRGGRGGRRERGAARRGGGRHDRRAQHRRLAEAGRRAVSGARAARRGDGPAHPARLRLGRPPARRRRPRVSPPPRSTLGRPATPASCASRWTTEEVLA